MLLQLKLMLCLQSQPLQAAVMGLVGVDLERYQAVQEEQVLVVALMLLAL
jgi:hypothetical protein